MLRSAGGGALLAIHEDDLPILSRLRWLASPLHLGADVHSATAAGHGISTGTGAVKRATALCDACGAAQ